MTLPYYALRKDSMVIKICTHLVWVWLNNKAVTSVDTVPGAVSHLYIYQQSRSCDTSLTPVVWGFVKSFIAPMWCLVLSFLLSVRKTDLQTSQVVVAVVWNVSLVFCRTITICHKEKQYYFQRNWTPCRNESLPLKNVFFVGRARSVGRAGRERTQRRSWNRCKQQHNHSNNDGCACKFEIQLHCSLFGCLCRGAQDQRAIRGSM